MRYRRGQPDPNGATSVLGLYAAGNVTDPSQQMSAAAAAGSKVAAAISFDLAEDDRHNRIRASANETDWDHRYTGDQPWSGNPNGTLVNQISGLTPGCALDVGAGEGGDALWLAEHGWQVTANDVSRRVRPDRRATPRTKASTCSVTTPTPTPTPSTRSRPPPTSWSPRTTLNPAHTR